MDLTRLTAYLEARVEGFRGPVEAQAFTEGQSNPTYRLHTPSGSYVMRKQPEGKLLKGAHAVDREFRVQAALARTEVPVAPMLHLCEDVTVIGTRFYLMEHVEGRIFWDPALPELSPVERGQIYDEMNAVLAAIHDADLQGCRLESYGRQGGYFARQLHVWSRQYAASGGERIAEMEPLIAWLGEALPDDEGETVLVHGDYRIDNLVFAPDSLRIVAVFDWELSTLGHPLADLAYQAMQRAMPRDGHLRGLVGLDLRALGIPGEEEYLASYCARRGIAYPAHWHFAKTFAFFRFAAICQGVGARGQAGNNASPNAAKVGAMARPLAQAGLRLAQDG
jgi:aminoglycoside phosphotransferase (APT) family kinase protein